MDGQLHIVLLTDGDHRLQEVLKVAEQILVGHGGVLGEELFQLRHTLRLPARHLEVTGTLLDAVGKGLRISDAVDNGLVIGQNGSTVEPGLGQIRAGPVEHRHEVVADDLDPSLTQAGHGLAVVVNVFVPTGQAQLDVLVDIDAFDDLQLQTDVVDFLLQRPNTLRGPQSPGGHIHQGTDNAAHVGDLLDIAQRYGIHLTAIPAKCHFHG